MVNLQLESRHKEFFGVLCLHNYFTDNICRELVFEPTPETAMLLRNYGLVFKPADFGFIVLYAPEDSPERLAKMPPKTRLSFNIKSTTDKFMNFTQIPFWPEGVAFHYSNLCKEEAEIEMKIPRDVYYYFKRLNVGNVKKKLVHLPEHVLLNRRPKRFNYRLMVDEGEAKGVSYNDVSIKDEWGEETLEKGVPYKKRFRDANRDLFRRHLSHATRGLDSEGLSPSKKEKRIIEIGDQQEKELSAVKSIDQQIDLRHAPYGKYTVQMGKNPPRDVLISESPDNQVFGILDIHVDAPKDALLNRKAKSLDDVVNPQLFHFNFQARSTYWRYIFMNYDNSKVTPKLIRDEGNQLSFTDPVEGRLEQIGTEMSFSQSEKPIPLKDRPQHVLFLSRMNGKRSMKEIRLATPVPDKVKPERVDGERTDRIISEVYVYL